jgi:hypothetical protein
MFKLYVTMIERNGFKHWDRVVLRFDGDKRNLRQLMKALDEVKQECNSEANRLGKPLRFYTIEVDMF